MLIFEPNIDKRENFNPRYPDAMECIIEYIEGHGKLNVSYSYLEKLWEDFSDTYAAGFLEPNTNFLEEFVQWLSRKTVENSYGDYDSDYSYCDPVDLDADDEETTDDPLTRLKSTTQCMCWCCGTYPIELCFDTNTMIYGYSFMTDDGMKTVCRECYENYIEPLGDTTIKAIPLKLCDSEVK